MWIIIKFQMNYLNSNFKNKIYSVLTHFLFFNAASFEVTVNRKLVFSKLETGAFPLFKEVNNTCKTLKKKL